MTDTTPPGLNEFIRERRDMALLAAVIVVLLISIVVAGLGAGFYPFPGAVVDNFPFAEWINDGEA